MQVNVIHLDIQAKQKAQTKVVIIIKCGGHVFKNITIYTGIVINTIINNYEL